MVLLISNSQAAFPSPKNVHHKHSSFSNFTSPFKIHNQEISSLFKQENLAKEPFVPMLQNTNTVGMITLCELMVKFLDFGWSVIISHARFSGSGYNA